MSVTDEERTQVIELYKKGYRFTEITEETGVSFFLAKKILMESSVHEERRGHYVRKPKPPREQYTKRPDYGCHDSKNRDAIKYTDILEARRTIEVGDVISIRTEKGDRFADKVKDKVQSISGALRNVTVVDTSNRRFCIVKLESGVTEAILWSEIAIAIKNNKENLD